MNNYSHLKHFNQSMLEKLIHEDGSIPAEEKINAIHTMQLAQEQAERMEKEFVLKGMYLGSRQFEKNRL